MVSGMETLDSRKQSARIVCPKCGAQYKSLPAFTCPRCGTQLCPTGCDGCTAKCAHKKC